MPSPVQAATSCTEAYMSFFAIALSTHATPSTPPAKSPHCDVTSLAPPPAGQSSRTGRLSLETMKVFVGSTVQTRAALCLRPMLGQDTYAPVPIAPATH